MPYREDKVIDPRGRGQGLTLIELLVVLVIVGVLLMVSLPLYNNTALRSNRQVAKVELQKVLARQEQFLQENKNYAAGLDDLGLPGVRYSIDSQGTRLPDSAPHRVYLIALSSVDGGFSVSAEPQLGQRKDKLCGEMSLQNDGRRFSAGSASLEKCW
jgi:type IV pilus assembly protein PilE